MRWRRYLSDNRWSILLGAAALLWANLPYLAGYAVQDSNHLFSGFFIFEQDGFSYLAKMRQGAQGSWLFRLPYTSEAQPGAFVYVFYLVAGKLSRALGLAHIVSYHLIRVLGSVLLLVTSARFIARFADTRRWQLLSWLLILWGGGIDWLISMVDPQYISYASTAPDAFVYSVLFGPPHIILALTLLLSALQSLRDLFDSQATALRLRRIVLFGMASLGLAMCRPEYVAILVPVAAAYWLALCWQDRKFYFAQLLWAGTAALPALSYAAYVFLISRTEPTMAAWAAQNPFESPPIPNLLAGIGLLLAPATLGIIGWPGGDPQRRHTWWHNRDRLLLTAWILILPLLLYSPLSLNRRLIGGVQLPMAVAAGYWLEHHVLSRLPSSRWKRIAASPILVLGTVLVVSYPVLFGLSAASFVSARPDSLFLSPGEVAGYKWLADQDGRPVILASETTGNRIPAFSAAIPILGHPIETLAVEQKRADVSRFYAASVDPAERSGILDEYKINLVWWGETERKLGYSVPTDALGLEQVFDSGSNEIWRRREPRH